MGKRITTALVLIPIVLTAGWFLPTQWFALCIAVVAVLAAWEWGALLGYGPQGRAWYCLFICFVFALVYFLLPPSTTVLPIYAGLAWWILAGISLFFVTHPAWWWFLSGIAVLLSGWYGLIWVHNLKHGPQLVIALFFLIWIADSAAYYSGRKFGRRKLAPRLSPGKTVEGLIGAIIAALCFATITTVLVLRPGAVTLVLLGGMCVFVVLASVVGDLFESQFKRSAGVKDSGNWLPGHGGILDRVDSMLAAAPVFALGVHMILPMSGTTGP